MPEYTHFRLGERTLAQLDTLAAGAGSRTQAVREATAYWTHLVREAASINATELSEEDWVRLAHLNQPESLPGDLRDEEDRTATRDWSQWLAIELVGMWEGRSLALPYHQEEARACRALAKRIARWGTVRGYALFACLRWLWRHEEEDTRTKWWTPEVWMESER